MFKKMTLQEYKDLVNPPQTKEEQLAWTEFETNLLYTFLTFRTPKSLIEKIRKIAKKHANNPKYENIKLTKTI